MTIGTDEWRTPPELFKKVIRAFPDGMSIDLDAAATRDNRLCEKFFSMDDDTLNIDWYNPEQGIETVWLNPPFSRMYDFLDKANEEWRKGATIVCLVRADSPETSWWRDNIVTSQGYLKHRVFYLYPRLQYCDENGDEISGVRFPSCLVLMQNTKILYDSRVYEPRWIEWRKYIDFKYVFDIRI